MFIKQLYEFKVLMTENSRTLNKSSIHLTKYPLLDFLNASSDSVCYALTRYYRLQTAVCGCLLPTNELMVVCALEGCICR